MLKKILSILLLTVFLFLMGVSTGYASLTLDKKGRFGCLACHNDKRLEKKRDGKNVSLFIDGKKFLKSVHGKIACLDCHTDFSFRDHSNGAIGFKKTAGLACIRCHKHKKQYKTYLTSIHGRLALSNDPKKGATCGDCHAYKIHAISKSKEFWNEYFYNADKSCGKEGCHKKYYDSYFDYYHGQAYKKRAVDAPACWDCHGNHDVYKKGETLSSISENNIGKTCGRCHPDSQNVFGNSYREAIHGKEKMNKENFVISFVSGLNIKKTVTTQVGNVYNSVNSFVGNIFKFFFPESLRPRKKQASSEKG